MRPRLFACLSILTIGAVFAGVTTLRDPKADADDGASVPTPDTRVTVGDRTISRPVQPGFVGVSIEYPALTQYAGTDPSAPNRVFEQLLRNLAPGQRPVVRVGGNSTDTTWWPPAGARTPPWASYSLSHRWLDVVRALAVDTGAQFILGVNLESRHPSVAATEANAFLHGLGPGVVAALEPGNEPTRYHRFPFYRHHDGRGVLARASSYGFPAFNREFARVVRILPRRLSVAGPTFAGFGWMPHLQRFMNTQPRLRLVTFHRYTLTRCWETPDMPHYGSLPRLLSTFASRFGEGSLARYVAATHLRGLSFRVDEMNSVACGGQHGVSDVFGSALWSVDALFALVQAGVDGANIHTFPGAAYQLFTFQHKNGRWTGAVKPEYYGLLAFSQAAPPGSRLLQVRKLGSSGVRVWSTLGRDGTVRVALINADVNSAHTVLVRTPTAASDASLTRLTAPSVSATDGVSWGGASFGASTSTGVLARPATAPVRASGQPGRFVVSVPAGSEATLTVPAR